MDTRESIVEMAKLEMARRDFAYYCEYVHEGRWIPTRFHKALCAKVQGFVESDTGHPYDVLIITTPPQFGKSQTVTETFPSWYLLTHQNHRIILASYNEDFAEKFGRSNRQKMNSVGKKYGVSLARFPSGATEFELSNHVGSVISRGVMSGITGRSAELIVIDDPVKNRQEADSETYRDRLWDEWLNSIKTRLQAKGKVVVILTRWHEDDLAGRLIANDPYVEVWRVPCEAEENDILGRSAGEGLCPEIGKGTDWLRAFKESYLRDANDGGLRAWNALYQGRPSALEGNLIRREWFNYYSLADKTTKTGKCIKPPEKYDRVWQSWDCAFKDGEKSDFVCGMVFGRRGADYFLLDVAHGRMDFLGTLDAIRYMSTKWPLATVKLIEEKANGAAIINVLKHDVGGFIPIVPRESKIARASAVTGHIAAGNVYLPHPSEASWVNSFLDEAASFPNGSHDDMVDAFSQGLSFYMFDTRNIDKEEIPEGTHVYQMLKMKGWKEHQIRKAFREGRIKLLGAPRGFS